MHARPPLVPNGPDNMNCPLDRKPMCEVCAKCPLWMRVTTQDPQTALPIDEWTCALAWSAILQVKMVRETQVVAQEMNEMRNEVKKAHDESLAMGAIAVQRSTQAIRETLSLPPSPHPLLIEDSGGDHAAPI